MRTSFVSALLSVACGALAGAAAAAPMTYEIDPQHTYPSFEADHMGGMSTWRGKINSSSGKIVVDKQAGTGTVDVTMDMKTIDFGIDALNAHAQTPDLFDTAKYPTAHYTGKLVKFQNGTPTEVDGTLTLHGVSKPVTLRINSFHPPRKIAPIAVRLTIRSYSRSNSSSAARYILSLVVLRVRRPAARSIAICRYEWCSAHSGVPIRSVSR